MSAALLSRFALFRRPSTPTDAPQVEGGLRVALNKLYELSSYYSAYARRLAIHLGGRRYFAIPAFARPEALPPTHCLSTRARHELAEEQRRRRVEPVYCIIEMGGPAEMPVPGCEAFAQVDESRRALHVSDFLGEPTVELVPDGIAAVRITYRARPPIVVRVSENAFLLTPPRSPASRLGAQLRRLLRASLDERLTQLQRRELTRQYNNAYTATYPIRIEWLDSAGRLVRTIAPPQAASNSATSVGDLRAPLEG